MTPSKRQSGDDVLARAVATGKTIREAAELTGVSESTIYRRLREPPFAARVQQIRSGGAHAASGTFIDGMKPAADALVQLAGADNPHIRLKAAKVVIDLGMKLRELVDLDDRLNRVERIMAGEDPDHPGPEAADNNDPDAAPDGPPDGVGSLPPNLLRGDRL